MVLNWRKPASAVALFGTGHTIKEKATTVKRTGRIASVPWARQCWPCVNALGQPHRHAGADRQRPLRANIEVHPPPNVDRLASRSMQPLHDGLQGDRRR